MKSDPSTADWEARKNIWLPLNQWLMIWRKGESKLDFCIRILPFLALRRNFMEDLLESME